MNNKIAYVIMAGLLGLFQACSDADNFYGVLDTQPEIVADLNAVYTVGDTLTIRGRLNPENNLDIHIGDVKADVLETTTEKVINNQNGLVLDVVKVRITEAMGIGEDRPITLTSAGFTIEAPSIEIVGDANVSILDKQLQLVKVADMPAGSTPLYCRNGKGNVYAWNNTGKVLFRINAADGSVTQEFTQANCMDARGTFTIAEFNAGAVSPDERYFYFSAKVTETAQDRTLELYKLCRFDLQNSTLTTLNRTEYSLLRSRRTLAAAQPFEGPVDGVKIYKITAFWPDAEGNVYCNLMGHFLAKLDNQGAFSYMLDFSEFSTGSTAPNTDAIFIPLINDPNTGEYYSSIRIHNALPGTKINYGMDYLDAEAMMMYTTTQAGTRSLQLTDMVTLIQTGEYTSIYRAPDEISYATASLKRFNGGLVSNFRPLPVNGKLLGLYFQTTESRGVIDGGTLCEIDFENQKATRYAPNELLFNGFTLGEGGINGDRLLDYDAEGMLYMTTNNSSVIIKNPLYRMRKDTDMKRKKNILSSCLLAAILGVLLTACEENLDDTLPADGNIAYVNFVNAGEVFLYGQDNMLYSDNRLYVNDSINNAPFDNYNGKVSYPAVFNYEPQLDIRQFPQHFTANPFAVDNSAYGDVYWLPVHTGDYRFIFTSKHKTYLHTQNTTLGRQTYQVLYLVESPYADDAYTVVNAPIERKDRVEGSVTIQFVNLSPDAGEVEAYRVDAAGNEMATATTLPLAFGEYTTAELTTTGTQDTYNGILLRFRRPGGEDLTAVSVPANSGAVYTVLLRGFAQQTERKVKEDNETTITVTVLPDLRCSIRRVFY